MMEGDSLKLNFEIALDKIDKLTQHNNELLDTVERLEDEVTQLNGDKKNCIITNYEPPSARFAEIKKEADIAMKRFSNKLRKENNKNAKSKQSQRQSV